MNDASEQVKEDRKKDPLEVLSEAIDRLLEIEKGLEGRPASKREFGDGLAMEATAVANVIPGGISSRELVRYHEFLVSRERTRAEESAVTSVDVLGKVRALGLSAEVYFAVEEAVQEAYGTKR